ncbi:MAG: hypothetical protein GY842_27955, partial [bacterium]|nr:hypothetical protein [bacterium]
FWEEIDDDDDSCSEYSPSARWGAQALYDELNHLMIVFGGGSTPVPRSTNNELWLLDLRHNANKWRRIDNSHIPPFYSGPWPELPGLGIATAVVDLDSDGVDDGALFYGMTHQLVQTFAGSDIYPAQVADVGEIWYLSFEALGAWLAWREYADSHGCTGEGLPPEVWTPLRVAVKVCSNITPLKSCVSNGDCSGGVCQIVPAPHYRYRNIFVADNDTGKILLGLGISGEPSFASEQHCEDVGDCDV